MSTRQSTFEDSWKQSFRKEPETPLSEFFPTLLSDTRFPISSSKKTNPRFTNTSKPLFAITENTFPDLDLSRKTANPMAMLVNKTHCPSKGFDGSLPVTPKPSDKSQDLRLQANRELVHPTREESLQALCTEQAPNPLQQFREERRETAALQANPI